MMHIKLIIVNLAVLLISCNNQRDNDFLKGLELNLTEYPGVFENKEDVVLLVIFDGDCSAVII